MKLYKDFILLPLEQPIGGFATVQLGVDGKLGDVQEEHYPLDELGEGDDVVDQSKSYCLSINEGGWVYSFVAETNAVYVYCLYDVAGVNNKNCS